MPVLFQAVAEDIFFLACTLTTFYFFLVRPVCRSVVECVSRSPAARIRDGPVLSGEGGLQTIHWRYIGGRQADWRVDIAVALADPGHKLHGILATKLGDLGQKHAIVTGLAGARTDLDAFLDELSRAKARYDAHAETVLRVEDRVFTLRAMLGGKLEVPLRKAIANAVAVASRAAVQNAVQQGLANIAVGVVSAGQWAELSRQIEGQEAVLARLSDKVRNRDERSDAAVKELVGQLRSTISSQAESIAILAQSNDVLKAGETDTRRRLSELETLIADQENTANMHKVERTAMLERFSSLETIISSQQTRLEALSAIPNHVSTLEATIRAFSDPNRQQVSTSTNPATEDTLNKHAAQLEELSGVKTSVDTLTKQCVGHDSAIDKIKEQVTQLETLRDQVGNLDVSPKSQHTVPKQLESLHASTKMLEESVHEHALFLNKLRHIPAEVKGLEDSMDTVHGIMPGLRYEVNQLRDLLPSVQSKIDNAAEAIEKHGEAIKKHDGELEIIREDLEEDRGWLKEDMESIKKLERRASRCEAELELAPLDDGDASADGSKDGASSISDDVHIADPAATEDLLAPTPAPTEEAADHAPAPTAPVEEAAAPPWPFNLPTGSSAAQFQLPQKFDARPLPQSAFDFTAPYAQPDFSPSLPSKPTWPTSQAAVAPPGVLGPLPAPSPIDPSPWQGEPTTSAQLAPEPSLEAMDMEWAPYDMSMVPESDEEFDKFLAELGDEPLDDGDADACGESDDEAYGPIGSPGDGGGGVV